MVEDNPSVQKLNPRRVRMDGGTQPRSRISSEVVDQYCVALRNKAKFPAIVVFYDGQDYWLADGFHRVRAHLKQRRRRILAEIRQGTRRDAILWAAGANGDHGLQRSHEDIRRAVMTLLRDAEWGQWSDAEIARHAKVHHSTVSKHRRDLRNSGELRTPKNDCGTAVILDDEKTKQNTQTTDGNKEVRKYRTAKGNIGLRKIAKTAQENPPEPGEEIARRIDELAAQVEQGEPIGALLPAPIAQALSELTGSAVMDDHARLRLHRPITTIGADAQSQYASALWEKDDIASVVAADCWMQLDAWLQTHEEMRRKILPNDLAAAIPLQGRTETLERLRTNASFALRVLASVEALCTQTTEEGGQPSRSEQGHSRQRKQKMP